MRRQTVRVPITNPVSGQRSVAVSKSKELSSDYECADCLRSHVKKIRFNSYGFLEFHKIRVMDLCTLIHEALTPDVWKEQSAFIFKKS